VRAVRPSVVAAGVILAAPLIWFTHFSVVYALVPLSCRWNSDLPLHAASLVAACTAAVSIRFARRAHAIASDQSDADDPPDRTVEMIALVLSVYFAFLMVMTAMVTVIVDRCA
jgi:hypothetical protein